jgi:hypothetical protein
MGWPPLAALRLGPWLAPCGIRLDGTAYCNVPAGAIMGWLRTGDIVAADPA